MLNNDKCNTCSVNESWSQHSHLSNNGDCYIHSVKNDDWTFYFCQPMTITSIISVKKRLLQWISFICPSNNNIVFHHTLFHYVTVRTTLFHQTIVDKYLFKSILLPSPSFAIVYDRLYYWTKLCISQPSRYFLHFVCICNSRCSNHCCEILNGKGNNETSRIKIALRGDRNKFNGTDVCNFKLTI